MKIAPQEQRILDAAIDALRTKAEIPMHLVEARGTGRRDQNAKHIAIPALGTKLVPHVKKAVNKQNFGAIFKQLLDRGDPHKVILVTRHVNPEMAFRLRENGIQFLDTVGNAYLQQPELFIFIVGLKPELNAGEPVYAGRAFQAAGMKLVCAFLQDEQLINGTYRNMADAAGIALGAVGDILKDLTARGFLGGVDKQRQLLDRRALIAAWTERYATVLRGKHHLATFTTENAQWWQDLDPRAFHAAWGGELAAATYTDYLNPRDAIVYIDEEHLAPLLKQARLRKPRRDEAPRPRIDFYEPFWGDVGNALAPPLIVYADLITTGDVRNLEAAERIYEKYID